MSYNIHPYISVPYFSGMSNVLKIFISYFSIDELTKIESNLNYVLGDFSTILESKHIINPQIDTHYKEVLFNWRFLILHTEVDQQHYEDEYNSKSDKYPSTLFRDDIYIDLNYDRKFISDTVFNRITTAIDKIKWNPIVLEEVKMLTKLLDQNTLGITVRTWKGTHEMTQNIPREYSKEKYILAIKKFTENSDLNINTIFLSCDNTDIYNEYSKLLSGYNLIIYRKPSDITPLQYGCIKMLVLAKCKYLVGTRISSFTEMVVWLSKFTQRLSLV